MYNYNTFNPQAHLDKLNNMKADIERQIAQMSSQPVIQQNFVTQGFQSDFDAKWVDNKEQVTNAQITRDSIFMDRNAPIFYIKTTNGEIKAFLFEEYIEIDPKDKEIEDLKKRLELLEKGGTKNESTSKNDGKPVLESNGNKQSNGNVTADKPS